MKKSVLVVDDDKDTCKSISRALSNDYLTFTASNGREALEILNKSEDIDVVLTDMMMPEMNGIELLENIRSTNSDIVVIMITGHSSIESAVDAMRLGAYDYINKPVDLNKLEITLKNAIENKKLRSENILLKQKIKEKIDVTTVVIFSDKMFAYLNHLDRFKDAK
jgi:DNA-binding NtrC family response regulator